MQKPGTPGFHVISIGSEVFTTDGERLGAVEEVRVASFKVDATLEPGYWLPSNTVASIMGKRITLAFGSDRLDRYRSALPGAA
jgi:hypothetical protein